MCTSDQVIPTFHSNNSNPKSCLLEGTPITLYDNMNLYQGETQGGHTHTPVRVQSQKGWPYISCFLPSDNLGSDADSTITLTPKVDEN